MTQTVILDLDGPVLDGKLRHFTCYSRILRRMGYVHLTLDQYWTRKRRGLGSRQLLAATGADLHWEEFHQAWLDIIEQPSLIDMDRVHPGVETKLREWRKQGLELIVSTLRQDSAALERQLANLKLTTLFDHIFVISHQCGGAGKAKEIRNSLLKLQASQCVWIGDSETDIEAARSFGCPICAVTCGVRDEAFLMGLRPDLIQPDIRSVNLPLQQPAFRPE